MSEASVSAVVLAAGEGRRLDPLTNRRPKPMVPVANRPILEYVVSAIADAGVDRIVLVVGYRQERIKNHFGDGDDWDVDIEYVTQQTQLGTAHAVLQAESAVSGPFLVLNGDRIVAPSLVERVCEEIVQTGDAPVMSVTRSAHASNYGVVSLEGERVTDIIEKPAQPVRSEIINAGVYGFTGTIFDAIEETPTENGEIALTTTLKRILESNPIRAVRYRDIWLDVSHLWDLLEVNAAVIEAGESESPQSERTVGGDSVLGADVSIGSHATIGGNTAIGDNVTIESNAVIQNSVIFSDAVIEAGAVVRDAVVAENARIGANSTVSGDSTTVVVDGHAYEDVSFGGIIGDNTTIGAGVTIEPGAVIGDNAVVDPGVNLAGRIEPGAIVRRG